MNNFREFQFATIIFIIAIPAQIFLAFMYITQAGTHPMSLASFGFANVTFSGSAGVELTFKDTSRIIRIGSANAPALKNTISVKIDI